MAEQTQRARPSPRVVSLYREVDDRALVAAVRAGRAGASHELYTRYAGRVHRTLVRVLGPDGDIPDLLHEVFAQAFSTLERLEDPERLAAWLRQIAVHIALGQIRYRSRRRWLSFSSSVPDMVAKGATMEVRAEARAALAALERLSPEHRVAFALRHIEGMALGDVAEACQCSLATIKRRLKKAEARFVALARSNPALQEWIERGGRWGAP